MLWTVICQPVPQLRRSGQISRNTQPEKTESKKSDNLNRPTTRSKIVCVEKTSLQTSLIPHSFTGEFYQTYKEELNTCLSQTIFFVCLFVLSFLGLHLWHLEFPRLEVQSELKPPAYATATAILDQSHFSNLHHISGQYQILNPLSKATDQTRVLMDASRVC